MYWEGAPNLISVSRLSEKGVIIVFQEENAKLMNNKNEILYIAKRNAEKIYHISYQKIIKAYKAVSKEIWHTRLNHCGNDRLEKTISSKECNDMKTRFDASSCKGCALGKLHRKNINKKKNTERKTLELLVADCIGPYDISIDKKKYVLVISDAGSGYVWSFPFLRKSDVASIYIKLLKQLERQYPKQIKYLRSDNGTEFKNRKLEDYCEESGIKQQFIIPYEHELNGRAEGMNRILIEATKALLFQSGLNRSFWTFAFRMATMHQNFLMSRTRTVSPWKMLKGTDPPLQDTRTFGVPGYSHIARENRRKLDQTAIRTILIGYSEETPGYLVYNPETNQIFNTRFSVMKKTLLPLKVRLTLKELKGYYQILQED